MLENFTTFQYIIKKEIEQHVFPSKIKLFFPDTTSGLLRKDASVYLFVD